jgi:apolipoprotein N-acyltransferase
MRKASAASAASGASGVHSRFVGSWQLPVTGFSLGLLHAATFAPWGAWWTQILVLGCLAAVLRSALREARAPARLALAGLTFGFGWFVAGVGWLFVSMHTYGMMPAPLALLALLLFSVYLGLFPAAAAWSLARLRAPARPASPGATLGFAFAFAATFTLAELVRGFLFTGFPWLAAGYAQVDGPLTGYAPLAGSYGVGFAACLVAALLAALVVPWPGRRAPALVGALGLAAAVLATGQALQGVAWSRPAGDPLAVRLLQGNVAQLMKFDPQVARQTMQRYLEMVQAEPADLIVLPETAWTVPWQSTPPELAQRLAGFVRSSGSAVAIGMPLSAHADDGRTMLTNSVLLFDRGTFAPGAPPPARYDKRHLVPFGEFVPWGFRWFVDLMTIPLGDFGRGGPDQPPFAVGQQRIAFNICYEDVFGEELLPALRGPDGATILANVSNIAWFGDSHALPQHLQIARMRAIETARPMIRATNTGVTAAIEFDGRLIAALPTYELGALSAKIQGRSGLTPYARTGNWPILALCMLVPAVVLVRSRKPAKIAR